jgi:hypothetical protein
MAAETRALAPIPPRPRVRRARGKRRVGNIVTAFGGLKLYPALRFKLKDLVDLKRDESAKITVSWSPFGWVDDGGSAFLKGAPIVRGMTEDEMAASTDLGIQGIYKGLQRAKDITTRHRETGVSLLRYPAGMKRVPTKAAAMAAEGKKAKEGKLVVSL